MLNSTEDVFTGPHNDWSLSGNTRRCPGRAEGAVSLHRCQNGVGQGVQLRLFALPPGEEARLSLSFSTVMPFISSSRNFCMRSPDLQAQEPFSTMATVRFLQVEGLHILEKTVHNRIDAQIVSH